MNLTLAPSGHVKLVKETYDAFPNWTRTHCIGHGGVFGRWKKDRRRALWPNSRNHQVAPDSGWWANNPDSILNRWRWSRHERWVREDVMEWAAVMQPIAGERITLNEETWSAMHRASGKWYDGKTAERHVAYLEAMYVRTRSALSDALYEPYFDPAVPLPDDAFDWLGPEVGCSGLFRVRGYTDIGLERMRNQSPTFSMDYASPQLYFARSGSIARSSDHFLDRFDQQLSAIPERLNVIPFISPFYAGTFIPVPKNKLQALAKFLDTRGIGEADVFVNSAVRNSEELKPRLDALRPALETMREVFGVGDRK